MAEPHSDWFLTKFSMLPYYFYPPSLPFEMILHLKAAAIKEKKKNRFEKQAVFLKDF